MSPMESMLGNLLGTLEPEFSLYSQVVEEEVKNLDPENPGNNVWRLLAIKREFDTLLEHISGYHRKEGELTMGKWQPPRRVLLVKIHIAATKMGLDEDTYRSLLYRYTAKTSAGDLSNAELSYVVTQIECDFDLRLEMK